MLGHWRVVLKQAEEAARAGRLDEALALASLEGVADHQQASTSRAKWTSRLVERASRRASADDVAGALDDLELAERHGAAPEVLAEARLKLSERVARDLVVELEAGEVGKVRERVDKLAARKLTGPTLRRAGELSTAWRSALDEARQGEFGRAREHFARAERLASAWPAGAAGVGRRLSEARREVESQAAELAPKAEAMYAALAKSQWPEALTAAEAVLARAPDHPAARQARAEAWRRIAAIAPASAQAWPERRVEPVALGGAVGGEPRNDAPGVLVGAGPKQAEGRVRGRIEEPPRLIASIRGSEPTVGRFLLWVDAVAGYLVCLGDRVVLGRAGNDGEADVPLLGDLSKRHATLTRDGDDYVLNALQPTYVNGRKVEAAALRDGDVVRLGSTVELEFHQPNPVSATARLAPIGGKRLPMAVDGVILMSDTCLMGATSRMHIKASGLEQPVVLYRAAGGIWCRAAGKIEVDGRFFKERAPLEWRSRVQGEGFSFSLEPLDDPSRRPLI